MQEEEEFGEALTRRSSGLVVVKEVQRGLDVRQLHLTDHAARRHGVPVEEVTAAWRDGNTVVTQVLQLQ